MHPYIWEIVRSYIFMAPECKNGEIDIEALIQYIKEYQSIAPLNRYDVENAGNLFYYFLAVCDFYGQYYQAHSRNRGIYIRQHSGENCIISIYWKEAGTEAVIGLEKSHNWRSFWNGIYSHTTLYSLEFV